MAEAILQVENLRKSFGKDVAVDNLTLSVHRGEVLGMLGANGAGKTTSMHMILGLITPDSGMIEVFGKNFLKHRTECLRKMNFSSTYANLPNNLTVEQNLRVFGLIYNIRQMGKRIDEVLELFEITHLKKRAAGHLSSGESTRLNLCKAFLNEPELLLLDEPTASLDPDIADKVRKAIKRYQEDRGISILYTSHNMRDIELVCDRVIFMHKGKMLAEGTSETLVEQFQEQNLEDVFIKIARDGEIEE